MLFAEGPRISINACHVIVFCGGDERLRRGVGRRESFAVRSCGLAGDLQQEQRLPQPTRIR